MLNRKTTIAALLRRPLLSGVIVGALVLLLGCAYALSRPTTYSATSVFSLVPRTDVAVSAATVQLLAGSYVAFLSSPAVADAVATATGEPPQAVASGTEVSLDTGSANIRIRVTLPTPQRAAEVANAVVTMAEAKAQRDRLVVVDPVSAALPEAAETNPPRQLLLTASALAAVLAGAVVAFVLAARRPAEAPDEERVE